MEDYFQAVNKLIVRIIGYICGRNYFVSAPKSSKGRLKEWFAGFYWLRVTLLGVESNLKPL